MPAPTLHTPRLTLRPHVLSDMDPFLAFFRSERARYMPRVGSRRALWQLFCADVAGWELQGFGGWGVGLRNGPCVGQVAITQPPHFPEPELGWTLFDGHEGHGYATEAAMAALGWAWSSLPIATLVSYVDPANTRSRRLAERLGATHDPAAPLPEGETPAETMVYRHVPDTDGSPEAYA